MERNCRITVENTAKILIDRALDNTNFAGRFANLLSIREKLQDISDADLTYITYCLAIGGSAVEDAVWRLS